MDDETGAGIGDYLIAGRYQPIRKLAGGMGIVYFCLDTSDDNSPVALKTFRAELLADRSARDRFLREASTWIDLGFHPNIVQAYRAEYSEPSQSVYLVLQLIPAAPSMGDPSLRSWMALSKPFKLSEAIDVCLSVSRGMRHATTVFANLVHRDIKPENILLGVDGVARVTDFGLASVTSASEIIDLKGSNTRITRLTRGVVGTPIYMSPEQWRGEPLDMRSDIYALGCVLLELVTSHRPVEGTDLIEIRAAHLHGGPLLAARDAGLAPALELSLTKFLDLDRANRLIDWHAVITELESLYGSVVGNVPEVFPTPIEVSRSARIQKGASYLAIGSAYLDLGKPRIGTDYFKKALEIGSAEDHPLLTAASTANLGIASAEMGDFRRAIELYTSAIDAYFAHGLVRFAALNIGNLGNAYFGVHDLENAEACLTRALELAIESGDERGQALWRGNMANVFAARGDFAGALDSFGNALAISRKLKDTPGECRHLLGLALAYQGLGNSSKAMEALSAALQLALANGDINSQGLIYLSLSNLLLSEARVAEARDNCLKCMQIANQVEDHAMRARALGNLGAIEVAMSLFESAIAHLTEAIKLANQLSLDDVSARAHWSLGILYEVSGEFNKAVENLRRAVVTYRRLGMHEYANSSKHLLDLRTQLGLL